MMASQQVRESSVSAADLIERILDKGLVINADIKIAVVGVELLDIKIRATLASFETAAKYGLEFPSGTRLETPAWQEAMVGKENCPHCAKRVAVEELMGVGCPWCGWLSAKARSAGVFPSGNGHRHEEIPQAEAR
jgi:ribosomal protein L37AE/L43A